MRPYVLGILADSEGGYVGVEAVAVAVRDAHAGAVAQDHVHLPDLAHMLHVDHARPVNLHEVRSKEPRHCGKRAFLPQGPVASRNVEGEIFRVAGYITYVVERDLHILLHVTDEDIIISSPRTGEGRSRVAVTVCILDYVESVIIDCIFPQSVESCRLPIDDDCLEFLVHLS